MIYPHLFAYSLPALTGARRTALCAPGTLDRFRNANGTLPSESNITAALEARVGRDLHLQRGHPLNTIKGIIEGHFDKSYGGIFHFADDRSPVVTTQMNFDDLLIPTDHVSRSPNDTYYIDQTNLLRTHTRREPASQCAPSL